MTQRFFEIKNDFLLKKVEKKPEIKKKKNKPAKLLLIDVGFYIIIPILLAVPAGLYLDSFFKTKNIFTLVLIFFGFICTIYNLIRLTKKLN